MNNDSVRCHCEDRVWIGTMPIARTIDGKYRLDQLIGRGGSGAVYEAEDLRLRRTVAVKVMITGAFDYLTDMQRFHREARAVATLNHPRIVSVHDFGLLGDTGAYLVMERVHGRTLRAELVAAGVLEPYALADWLDQLLDGLGAAHAHGIVHRDLKPENVMSHGASTTVDVKILDFGLAKRERLNEETATVT